MATTPVQLKVDGFTDREVMMVTYSFNQATDTEGQMSGIPRGGHITIRVKALNDGNPDLLNWMIAPNLAFRIGGLVEGIGDHHDLAVGEAVNF